MPLQPPTVNTWESVPIVSGGKVIWVKKHEPETSQLDIETGRMGYPTSYGPHEAISYPAENLPEMEERYAQQEREEQIAEPVFSTGKAFQEFPGGYGYYGELSEAGEAMSTVLEKERMISEPKEAPAPAPEEPRLSAFDREKFRSSAIKQLPEGKDPYMRDPYKEAQTLFMQRIDGLKRHIFKGLPNNAQLTPEQSEYFSKQAFNLYKMCFQEAQSNVENSKEALSNMMSRFDKMKEEQEAEGKKRERIPRIMAETQARQEAALPYELGEEARTEARAKRKEKRTYAKDEITVYKDGKSKIIERREWPKHQKAGWTREKEAKETGALTESQAIRQIEYFALDQGLDFATLLREYQAYRKKGSSRFEALTKVLEEKAVETKSVERPPLSQGYR